jgi:hypothetical protein
VIYKHLEGKDEYCRDVVGIYPMLEDETGVLSATTAFGKTVIGTYLVGKK